MRIFMSFGKGSLCKKVIKHFIIPLQIKTLVIFKSSWDMYLCWILVLWLLSIFKSISPHLSYRERIHCEIAEDVKNISLSIETWVWILNFITLFGALNLKEFSKLLENWNAEEQSNKMHLVFLVPRFEKTIILKEACLRVKVMWGLPFIF